LKLSVTKKLLAGFAIAVVPSVIIAGVATTKLSAASDSADAIYEEGVVATQLINASKHGFDVGLANAARLATTTDPKALEDLQTVIDADLTAGGQAFVDLKGHLPGASAERAYSEAEVAVTAFQALVARYAEAVEKKDGAALAKVAGEFSPAIEGLNTTMAALLTAVNDESRAQTVSSADAASSARQLVLALAALSLVIAAAVGIWLSRGISRGIGEAVSAARSIARGETNVDITAHSNDELGELADSFRGMTAYLSEMAGAAVAVSNGDLTASVKPRSSNDALGHALNGMVTNLREMIGNVRSGAAAITEAADSLRASSDQMASATGQIAHAIDEVTRSAVSLSDLSLESAREVERLAGGTEQLATTASDSSTAATQSREEAAQIGHRIQLVATASQEVAQAADESRTAAQQGQQAVGQAVSSMESIATAVQRASRTVDQLGEYGQQIGDIVKAIDEIAAQTNLLALNAAIEAARAGEQGRGFAVVAENVRSLAERSSESTKEIADLIAKVQSGTQEAVEAMAVGVRDVQQGQQITEEAGRALTSIIGTVELSASRMQEIARDVQGLASGAERIVTSTEQIAAMAQESAGSANQMAAGTTRVTEAITQVSATSTQTSAAVQDVSASTEELSAQSEELAATANQMRQMAETLTEATSRFRLA
jgi:methyl-accepting chemotaxis protein